MWYSLGSLVTEHMWALFSVMNETGDHKYNNIGTKLQAVSISGRLHVPKEIGSRP